MYIKWNNFLLAIKAKENTPTPGNLEKLINPSPKNTGIDTEDESPSNPSL